jgi:hypothetical protein
LAGGLTEKNRKNLLPGTYDQKMTLLIFISFLKITGQTGQRPKIARKYWGILVPFSPSAAISRRDNRTTAVDVIGDKVDQAQKAAQTLARHSDPTTTQGYIEVADEMRRLAADRISTRGQRIAADESPQQDSTTLRFAAAQGRRKSLK